MVSCSFSQWTSLKIETAPRRTWPVCPGRWGCSGRGTRSKHGCSGQEDWACGASHQPSTSHGFKQTQPVLYHLSEIPVPQLVFNAQDCEITQLEPMLTKTSSSSEVLASSPSLWCTRQYLLEDLFYCNLIYLCFPHPVPNLPPFDVSLGWDISYFLSEYPQCLV